MKRIPFIFICTLSIYFNGYAQFSDCKNAKPFCTATGDGEPTVFPGSGLIPDETRLSCVDNENYSTWYTFTPTSDGIFNFVLIPIDKADDYDWALFNITGHTCEDVPTNPSLLVSCNSWGNFGDNGPTGISTKRGGIGIQNGPGTTNGPPFNEDLIVKAGQTYVLMVSNWSKSTKGFKIDVSASTAEGVYANMGIDPIKSQEICLGDSAGIEVNFTGTAFGPITYHWEPASLFVDPNVEDPIIASPLEKTTPFSLKLTNGPCEYATTTNIYVGTIEYDISDKTLNICLGESGILGVNFTGVVLPSGLKYTWSPTDLISGNPLIPNPPTIPLRDTTKYYLQLKNGPCEVSDSLIISTHDDTVHAEFTYLKNDDLTTIPIEVDFDNLSSGRIANYWWNFDDGSDLLKNSNPGTYLFPGYDTYDVYLAVASETGYCVDTARETIDFPEVVFPNIITPNHDGINDRLFITGLKVGAGIIIYNRWGKVVYKADNYLHDWEADQLPDGSYYFEIMKDTGDKIKGWVQVVR